jgi:hypothetical protein
LGGVAGRRRWSVDGNGYRETGGGFAAGNGLAGVVGGATHQGRARAQGATTCTCGVPLYTCTRRCQVGHRAAVAKRLGGVAGRRRWSVDGNGYRETGGGFAAGNGLAGVVGGAVDQSRRRTQCTAPYTVSIPLNIRARG